MQLPPALSCLCCDSDNPLIIQDVGGTHEIESDKNWLSHEHLLVDFIGADSIQPETWNHDFKKLIPALKTQGFSDKEFMQLMRINPSEAFAID